MNIFVRTTYFGIESSMLISLILASMVWGIWILKSKNATRQHWFSFSIAVVLMTVAMTRPLAILAESYFSIHMLQHLIMLMIVPPLLWLSIPIVKSNPPTVTKWMRVPLMSWMLGVGFMWMLHLPFFYNFFFSPNSGLCNSQSIASPFLKEWIHPIHLMITMLVGLWFVFPILSPWKSLRVKPLAGIGFLVSACTACTILGIVVTFSPAGLFDGYNLIPDPNGVRTLLQTKYGLTAQMDQQMAGLIMWVPGCLIYLSGSLFLFNKWFSNQERPAVVNPDYHKNINTSA
ncbi:cytochrome c oxidase assembly protein [Saprospiraceae bacterium]|nr:cytochrome c oxidase assembly protein [Saprospiraceae bacterium]